ncbi:ribosomal RNA small subunit methyltransferase C [Shewanella sp. NFH-SH190041]|uniref:class I SAM-dependent methyltransferase n=1 Tax=Shewanella sp. NFH-SH190041 TaxID=2950245 RepID=UPI0021C3D823|nr:class I SAM-dependent methyltransferase [Shewanella sp. NFH-SH190041]BDM65768.1 ribosomal RNA small subunit methyltransferase C [Shewanella sp. NFH-SH190041]
MLTNPSQVIIRNSHLLENQSVLLLNHERDHLALELLQNGAKVTSLALDYHHYLAVAPLQNRGLNCYFGHQLPEAMTFDTVVIYFPKAKSLAPYLFDLAANSLKPGGQLLVAGENKGGIKSLPKLLPDYFSYCNKVDNARHCLLYAAQYEGGAPKLDIQQWLKQYTLTTPQGALTICNLVGVFSEKQLDQGTALLLEHLPQLQGRVLDFGCGAGVIAAALLKAQPELILDCVDINAMALASCQLTLAANGMQANVYPSDGLAQTKGEFQAIISNPPFHDGLDATTDIALSFVRDSAIKLSSGGIWQIVANRHLPYADTIATHFGQVNVTAENNKYKVYQQHK